VSRPPLYLRQAAFTIQPARPGRVLLSAGGAVGVDADIASAIELRDALTTAISAALTPPAIQDHLEFVGEPTRDGWYRWTLRGRHGGIDFEVRRREDATLHAGPIVVHSPVQRSDFDARPQENCSLLGGQCFADAGFSAGDELTARWMASGYDVAVIRAELESWYRTRLATPDGEVAR
jgi:hypothetical protein